MTPKNAPANPPTSGSNATDTGLTRTESEALIQFRAWIAKYAPRPAYTACPNESMPPWPKMTL